MRNEMLNMKSIHFTVSPKDGSNELFESILHISSNDATFYNNFQKKPYIILFPHGGPHSTSVTCYSWALCLLISQGYAILEVNYRGSLGFGEYFAHSLPGKAGKQDVTDIITALENVYLKKNILKTQMNINIPENMKNLIMGGSHGGFLCTHVIGQYPDMFVAASTRNPVVNMLAEFASCRPSWTENPPRYGSPEHPHR